MVSGDIISVLELAFFWQRDCNDFCFGWFWLVTKNPEMDLPKSASLFTPTWGDFVGGA